MRLHHSCIAAGILIAAAFSLQRHSQGAFPEWKLSWPTFMGLGGPWNRSDVVVVGDVSNVVEKGKQEIASPPAFPNVREIYWCEADFRADVAIKGALPRPGEKLLWGEARPGCSLEAGWTWTRWGYRETSAPITRVWFLRREGEYLRPIVDAGGAYFASFHWKWANVPKGAEQRVFATLLMDPAALGLSPGNYDEAVRNLYIAQSILGEQEVAVRVRALAALPGHPELRRDACGYLSGTLKEPCK
jgi:hypothetical protein